MLADFDAVDVGLDGIEQPAVLGRGVRLQVEGVHVRRAAGEVDEDRGFGGGIIADIAGLGQLEIAGQGQPARAQGTGFQEIPSFHSVASLMNGHEAIPLKKKVFSKIG